MVKNPHNPAKSSILTLPMNRNFAKSITMAKNIPFIMKMPAASATAPMIPQNMLPATEDTLIIIPLFSICFYLN